MYIDVSAILSMFFLCVLSKIGLCAFFVGSGLQRVKFGLSTCNSRLVGDRNIRFDFPLDG